MYTLEWIMNTVMSGFTVETLFWYSLRLIDARSFGFHGAVSTLF